MRISGRGSSGGFGSSGGRDRGQAFRRRHRAGERLSGRIMRHEAAGLAWVDFQGLELLARIESQHPPGTVLLFQVVRLDPEIVLQELSVARATGDPLGPAVDAFWLARSQFEALASTLLSRDTVPTAIESRRKEFLAAVASDEALSTAYTALETARDAACALVSLRGAGRLEYAPWLLPHARSGEIIVRERSAGAGGAVLKETAFSFSYPQAGQCELLLLQSSPRTSIRLLAEHPNATEPLLLALKSLVATESVTDFFSPKPLPNSARAGLLAPLLAHSPGGGPRFSLKV